MSITSFASNTINTDTTNFNSRLTSADDTVQKALETLDEDQYLVSIKTGNYTATAQDDVLICNKASAMTINLPESVGSGDRLIVTNISTGTVTISANTTQTINGDGNQTVAQDESVQLVDYTSGEWVII